MMAFRLYLVPKILSGDVYKPKYFADGSIAGNWSGIDYDDWYLMGADLSGADEATLTAQADVTALPSDLSATLTTGQVTAVQTKLEAANIPAGWVDTSYTWLRVVRIVCGVIRFSQRFNGRNHGRLLGGGITLDSTVGDLSANARAKLQEAAESLDLDSSGVTLATTIRALLRNLAGQLEDQPVQFGTISV
jgi:hypothetical protein